MIARSKCIRGVVTLLAIVLSAEIAARAEDQNSAKSKNSGTVFTSAQAVPDGKELFQREWLPNDPRAHGGDGLGPVFNDSSCVACHNLGGPGGGGPASKNVDIITAFSNQPMPQPQDVLEPIVGTMPAAIVNVLVDSVTNSQPKATVKKSGDKVDANQKRKDFIARQKKELAEIHPGFLAARSVVLHHFSTSEKYEPWRMQMLGLGNFFAGAGNFDISGPVQPAAEPQPAATEPQPTASTVAEQGQPAMPPNQSGAPVISVQLVNNIQVTSDMQSDQLMQQQKTQAQLTHAQGLQGRAGNFTFVHSRRNATALFGAGLIDKIPDSVLIEKAKQTYKDFPEIQGRVAKQKDGTIGRFGWKDQKSSLYEFAMTACAVELGLDVPDHPQSGLPVDATYKAKGHDMDQAECDALVDYLRNIPAPVERKPANDQEAEYLRAGAKQFAAVGCANCHSEKLGQVSGIFSDLLLHDMGPELGDSGNYGAFVPNAPEDDQDEPLPSIAPQQTFLGITSNGVASKAQREKAGGALRQEWRTPPLWGVRDSAPYMHDGRADTLEQAIAFHGGEASKSARQYFMLKPQERMQVVTFLKSLVAPDQSASAE
jgi:CxxC motif-containing protein (DUF1111 family)